MIWRHNSHDTMAAASLIALTCTVVAATLVAAQHYGSAAAAAAASYETEMMHHAPAPPHCVLTIKPINGTSNSYAVAPAESSYLSNYAVSRHGYANAYTGRSICITQHDVDAAVEEAKASLGGYVPKEIYTANSELPKPMHVTVVAEIITQATRILANRFKLPEPSILYDLPSIDLGKSASIDKLCPVFLKPGVNCEHTRYRTLTGFCNNLQYQSWGSSRSAMVRFLAPDYYDSISLPRRAYDGSPLPSARVVSFVVHQDPPEYDKYHSMLSVVWGQFIDHDMTLAVQATDENPSSGPEQVNCCKSEDAHPDCFPIEIPKGDPFYGYFNQKCMHFTRASPGLQPGCSLGPVQAMNKISGYMDGSLVYGSSIKVSQRLRTYHCGQLRTQPVSSVGAYGSAAASTSSLAEAYAVQHGAVAGAGAPNEHPGAPAGGEYLLASSSEHAIAATPTQRQQALAMEASLEYATVAGNEAGTDATGSYPNLKPLLPANKHSPDVGCERRGRAKDVYCFEAGDARANEQIQLTTLHTTLLREHNRLAKELSYVNPHWDDERLFQEARQIVVAHLQHITFNEFLPLVIGKDKIYEYGLELEHPGKYYRGYDSKINAGIRVEFQAAAFRYGHSILPSYIERYNKYHQKIEAIRLSKLLKQPYDLYHPGVVDTYLLGLANQRAGRMDPTLTTEVTNHLFEKPGKFFGIDLAAINIQRGRDMGVPGYNHFREYCGLPRAKYFEDLTGVFSNKTLLRLSQLYKHVDDIDLWTAGIAEYPIQDGLVGPTFACLIARQFVNLRRGDRFWYENAGYPTAQFTIEQLDEIRKSTSARLICDNSDDIDTIQASPMLIADPYTNPRVSCSSLPSLDLTKWREQTGYQPAPQAYGPPPPPPPHQPEAAPAPVPEHAPEHGHELPPAPLEHNALAGAAAPMPAHDGATASAIDEYMSSGGAGESYQPSDTIGHYEPVREHQSASNNNVQHQFVDHLVELANYRPEMTAYQASSGKAAAAAAAAAA